jgi:hypothetical protein
MNSRLLGFFGLLLFPVTDLQNWIRDPFTTNTVYGMYGVMFIDAAAFY